MRNSKKTIDIDNNESIEIYRIDTIKTSDKNGSIDKKYKRPTKIAILNENNKKNSSLKIDRFTAENIIEDVKESELKKYHSKNSQVLDLNGYDDNLFLADIDSPIIDQPELFNISDSGLSLLNPSNLKQN